ncbi:MAG: hypothetical protein PQJ59_16935 [Spirochaetales bacterium]|nr:hypothetical protein [Spirochaetales bacterium]
MDVEIKLKLSTGKEVILSQEEYEELKKSFSVDLGNPDLNQNPGTWEWRPWESPYYSIDYTNNRTDNVVVSPVDFCTGLTGDCKTVIQNGLCLGELPGVAFSSLHNGVNLDATI